MTTLFDLTGKVAIVTGAGRGLGKTIALGLAQHGADIVAVSRTLPQVEKVAAEITGLGRKAVAMKIDTSRRRRTSTAWWPRRWRRGAASTSS